MPQGIDPESDLWRRLDQVSAEAEALADQLRNASLSDEDRQRLTAAHHRLDQQQCELLDQIRINPPLEQF